MIKAKRHSSNPILDPPIGSIWDEEATFNGSIAKDGNKYHFVYRAMSKPIIYYAKEIELSSIGYAESADGVNMKKRRQLIVPEYGWEQYGCEDPRVTAMDGRYYIFYTALSNYPPDADSIKVAVAVTSDFKNIEEKHLVTPFNAKAAALFPEKVNGKFAMILSADTDRPPSKIAIAQFDSIEEIWSHAKWNHWKEEVDKHSLNLLRDERDHVEVGAAPIKTAKGWLLIYSYIKNYKNPPVVFGIEAVLLDLEDPRKIIGRTEEPILIPEEEYEKYGKVPNIVFPSGAIVSGKHLRIYYGAADTTCCLCEVELEGLIESMTKPMLKKPTVKKKVKMVKHEGNPIITPIKEHDWESKYTFNPAAIRIGDLTHIVYRAMGNDDTSVLGYASTKDGTNIVERLPKPIYEPREEFEKKQTDGYSGCEDPRLTIIDDTIYMCYTAYDGINKTRVAMTQIKPSDFSEKNWNWSAPQLISNPTRNNKNTCLFPKIINDQYVFLHRMGGSIWLDYKENLEFGEQNWLGEKILMNPIKDNWDSRKIGIASPPIITKKGFLLLYHGLSMEDGQYRLGAALLDGEKPENIISRLDYPILEPSEPYEFHGLRPGTVFPCGASLIGNNLFAYYGAADEFVAVAQIEIDELLDAF